ncbi:UvrD-helicase domain-containing protein [Pseudomonas chlororaphis]|uniref:UvrD-helicase domain-containing protein n=1 Tax=Pseudomonas chlororaphis TaxID=587753 RepID=UPI00209B0933|nr:UvrD-helicase domain-containing protein [Pseudomonas chlororaphis]MCO7611465.1 UvrD-helicase domain-containing protein [Pseudomonas chlororaphis]
MRLQDLVPPVTDADIEWVSALMSLRDLDEPRRAFLKRLDTLDVAACPGSGKTTLVVAKLAILGRHWRSRTQGICVLSHTNAAREEIERRLGATEVGQSLLRYPHFIDTIHGFVMRFLASPWLRSNGHPLVMIDDEATGRARGRALGHERRNMETFLGRKEKRLADLRLQTADFSNPLGGVHYICSPEAPSYGKLGRAMGAAASEGYFCYDEVFTLGQAMIEQEPNVAQSLQARFPCVLIDEMQDTDVVQNQLLNHVFPRDAVNTVVVRVGDPNQQIFEGDGESDGAFPHGETIDISTSFRFNQAIASLANNFAVAPIAGGLIGRGRAGDVCPNTIFVFPDDDTSGVLGAFAQLVSRCLPVSDRKDGVHAIGAVHRLKNYKAEQFPKALEHYWSAYRSDANSSRYTPKTFLEGIRRARAHLAVSGHAHESVEMIAKCLLQLAERAGLRRPVQIRTRLHRFIQRGLALNTTLLEAYQRGIYLYLFYAHPLREERWIQRHAVLLKRLIAELHPGEAISNEPEVEAYLAWTEPRDTDEFEIPRETINTYRSDEGENDPVDVQLSSMHAVKGKTHSATLIVETFSGQHVLEMMLPWLEGKPLVKKEHQVTYRKNRMLMYVGMTRPTHLLCLAVRTSALGEGEARAERRTALEAQGWVINELGARSTH